MGTTKNKKRVVSYDLLVGTRSQARSGAYHDVAVDDRVVDVLYLIIARILVRQQGSLEG